MKRVEEKQYKKKDEERIILWGRLYLQQDQRVYENGKKKSKRDKIREDKIKSITEND